MEKEQDTTNELYNADMLRSRLLESMRAYMSDPQNETGEHINELPQTQYDYIMQSAGREVFGGMDAEKDPLFLLVLCTVYTDLSAKYNKVVSLDGFAGFAGLAVEFVRAWSTDAKAINGKGLYINSFIKILLKLYIDYNYHISFDNNNILYNDLFISLGVRSGADVVTACRGLVFARLQGFREYEIKNGFLSSKQQLGAVALVNKEFAWSADTIAQTERARALTLADLPKMSNYVNHQNGLETSES